MYRYLEIMNFGNGDKRTTLLSAFKEKPKEEIGHIISDYKVVLKLSENEYKEINKLLEYKGEYSYNELKAKVSVLTEKIDKAIEEINYMITNADITEISAIKLKQILGDKE